jgi:hypothetical protein
VIGFLNREESNVSSDSKLDSCLSFFLLVLLGVLVSYPVRMCQSCRGSGGGGSHNKITFQMVDRISNVAFLADQIDLPEFSPSSHVSLHTL